SNNKTILNICLLCNIIILASLENDCSPEYCNFAGECSLINEKPTCKCYAEAFYGQYCERVLDLCHTDKNPCPIKESCIPYVGQMICDCKKFNCMEPKIKQLAPTKPLCSYNMHAAYGTKQTIVLSFEEIPTPGIEITVSTPTFLIGYVDTSRRRTISPDSIAASNHTMNLTATLDELGIRRHIKIPYDNALYYQFETKYFTPGITQLTVSIESFGKSNNSKQTMSLTVHVSHPRSRICLPKIVFQQCTDPMHPRDVDVEHFTNIQAIVDKRCYESENTFRTQWTIFDFEENISFYSTSVGTILLFKIPRYSLWYEALVDRYPKILLTVRMAFKEANTPWVYKRCYLKVTARNVIAHITGGHKREVSPAKWLILDGSQSRDPAMRPDTSQQLMYTWLLSSADGSNEEYLAFQSRR
ncbi:hypothetical protein KR093_010895, partial [Drosophila rubida]